MYIYEPFHVNCADFLSISHPNNSDFTYMLCKCSFGIKKRLEKCKLYIYLFIHIMALTKKHHCFGTSKYFILNCLSIFNGESEYFTKLVTKTLLYIDSRNRVARYIDVPNLSA